MAKERYLVRWYIGGPPSIDGWYIVVKRGFSSPSLMRFYSESHASWDRVIAWDGPIIIPMDQVKLPTWKSPALR